MFSDENRLPRREPLDGCGNQQKRERSNGRSRFYLMDETGLQCAGAFDQTCLPLAKLGIPAPVCIRVSVQAAVPVGNCILGVFGEIAAVLIPEVLHPVAVVEVAVGGDVEPVFLFPNKAAAGAVLVAISVDTFPLWLIQQIAVGNYIAVEIERPVPLCVDVQIVVWCVFFTQPDALAAADIIGGVFTQAAARTFVGVILRCCRLCRAGKAAAPDLPEDKICFVS